MDSSTLITDLSKPVLVAGAAPDAASVAMVMMHGRGATPADVLTATSYFDNPNCVYLAPEGTGKEWFPNMFDEPLARNEPHLSASLGVVGEALDYLGSFGFPPERVILYGFSQGACIALEFAVRNPRRYGGLVGLSGGLVGPDDLARQDVGSLAGTPVFMGCSDDDPYIARYRLERDAGVLIKLFGDVNLRLYPEHDHSINEDELAFVRDLINSVANG